jgi:Putative zinc-finger
MRSHKFSKTPNTCRREVEFIADYLSSGLDLQQQLAFETHLKVCSDCAAFLQTYKKTVELTRGFLLSQAELHRLPRPALRHVKSQISNDKGI